MAKKDLVEIIKGNPGCVAIIDNDWWVLRGPKPPSPMTDEQFEQWCDSELATADNVKSLGDGGYGSGNCYGGDVLQALAAIVGITVESV